jgi:ankyrin repeat protein
MTKTLPAQPDIEWLKKTGKQQLKELRIAEPAAKLHEAQLAVARDYGFASWRALKAHVDKVSLDGQILSAAMHGNALELERLLSAHPNKITITGGQWDRPLLHLAACGGHLDCVNLLLKRGFDVNQRDKFDKAYALHWAAAEGHLAVVKRLVAAGGDIDGEGDDHDMSVIGWATSFQHIQREVADYLLAQGAKQAHDLCRGGARSCRSCSKPCRKRQQASRPADEPLRASPHAAAFRGSQEQAGDGGASP